MFHVSMLRKYTPDPTHVVDWGELTVDIDGMTNTYYGKSRAGFEMQGCEASDCIMATLWSGGGNMGTRGHDACQLSLPIWGRRYAVSNLMIK